MSALNTNAKSNRQIVTQRWIKREHPKIGTKYFCFECGLQEDGKMDLMEGQVIKTQGGKHTCGKEGHKKLWQACTLCQRVWSITALNVRKRRGRCPDCHEQQASEQNLEQQGQQQQPQLQLQQQQPEQGELQIKDLGASQVEEEEQYTLRRNGCRFATHELHDECVQFCKTLARDLLKRLPLHRWDVISGRYKQALLKTKGEWDAEAVDLHGRLHLERFEDMLKMMLACFFFLYSNVSVMHDG